MKKEIHLDVFLINKRYGCITDVIKDIVENM